MAFETVVLLNLTPDEIDIIHELIAHATMEVQPAAASAAEDFEALLSHEGTRLVVLRIDEKLKRPDQTIRRIKRALKQPAPLIVLIPPEMSSKIKDCYHAGADDYWVLPLDTVSFPHRFYVMLEWGHAMVQREPAPNRTEALSFAKESSLWNRMVGYLRRIVLLPSPARPQMGDDSLIANKWQKIRRLGFGSFGEVWLVKTKESEDLAVAKVPHRKEMSSKFLQEAAILKRLAGHPNMVQLKEIVKQDGKAILIQEYAEGSTLQEMFDQRMDSAFKERAFMRLLDVVAYAHRHNIMHRDIKPENIIISPSGVVKLLDFGTGKDLTRRSISNTVIGSRPFMAPEQIMGKSRIASDVWALGVILYALATECLPFYDENEKCLMDLILEVAPESPRNLQPGLPEKLQAIVLKCLEKDWTRRYKNAQDLKDDLITSFPDFGEGSILP